MGVNGMTNALYRKLHAGVVPDRTLPVRHTLFPCRGCQ